MAIDYRERAERFLAALGQAGIGLDIGMVADAMRELQRALGAQRARKMTPERRVQMRARRASGERVCDLAEAFGVTEPYVSVMCKGVVVTPAPPPARTAPPLAHEIVALAGEAIGLSSGWQKPHRGRRRPTEITALRAAVLAMKQAGLTSVDMGLALGRPSPTARWLLGQASSDQEALRVARVVGARLAAGQREAA